MENLRVGDRVWYTGDKPGLIGRSGRVVAFAADIGYGTHAFVKVGRRVAFIWACFLAVACSPMDAQRFQGAPLLRDVRVVMPMGTRPEIVAGCRAWSAEGLACDVGDDAEVNVNVIEDGSACGAGGGEATLGEMTGTIWSGRGFTTMRVFTDCGVDRLERTAAHEIGHGLGLEHGPAGALMEPVAPGRHSFPEGRPVVTQDDHEALARALGVSL